MFPRYQHRTTALKPVMEHKKTTSWWLIFSQPHLKNMLVKLDHETPRIGMKIKIYLSCHHLQTVPLPVISGAMGPL